MIVRASGPVNATPQQAFECMYDEEAVKYIEENLESCEVVGRHKQNLMIINKKTS